MPSAGAPANLQTVLNRQRIRNGLVGWYTFDDGSGTDFSGFRNQGVLNNGPTRAPGRVPMPGGPGWGLRFGAGGTESVTVATPNSFGFAGAFTLSAWVYSTSFAGGGVYQTIVEHNDAGADWFGLWKSGSGALFHFRVGSVANDFVTAGVAINTWYHVVGVYDGTTMLKYQNGKLDSTNAVGTPPSVVSDILRIGLSTVGAQPWVGIIDDVRIYNRALSAGEISALYYSAFQPIEEVESDALAITAVSFPILALPRRMFLKR